VATFVLVHGAWHGAWCCRQGRGGSLTVRHASGRADRAARRPRL